MFQSKKQMLLVALAAGCLAVVGCGQQQSTSESCRCEVTVNGVTKTSNTCGEKLCFGSNAYICGTSGSEFVSNGCASGGGGQ